MKSGDETLFEKIFLSQFRICVQYLIAKFRIDYETAYDITMDTLIDFRQKIVCGKLEYGNLRYLFTKIATQKLSKSKEHPLEFDSWDEADEVEIDHVGNEKMCIALENAWEVLTAEEKSLLEKFYYNDMSIVNISKLTNIPDFTLRKQKQRAVERLKIIFFEKYKI
jgi:DNA-directed RNA polymerase specialized sigma24 family protein